MAAKYLDIKMATVIEEEFENEEHNVRAQSFYIEEDGPQMKDFDKLISMNEAWKKEDEEEDAQTNSEEDDSSRRGSIVEREADAPLNSDVINSLIKSDTLPRSKPPPLTITPPSGARKPSRLPKATPSPGASPTTGSSFSFPSAPSAASSGGSNSKSNFFTLFVKEKYVTELFFEHPFCASKKRRVSLGLFLATSRITGDHTVYKISPLSPLSSLHLQPQDKIVKINGFDTSFWSHNTVINFVSYAAHHDQNKFVSPQKPFSFTFSLEYIQASKPITSPDLGPSRIAVKLDITLQKNGRASVTATVRDNCIRYRNDTSCIKLISGGQFLRVVEDNSTMRIRIGEVSEEIYSKFRIHKFEHISTSDSGGHVVALETVIQPGTFLNVGMNAAGATLSLVTATDIRHANCNDTKLFRMKSVPQTEGQYYSIKSVATVPELYLTATGMTVSLMERPSDTSFPSSMKFSKDHCSTD